jgi:RNA polymerase sigma-70 factor (ECF subfamily)
MLRFQSGEDAAFVELEARYRGRLASFFRNGLSLNNFCDANDLEAETLMQVVISKKKYDRSKGSVKAWIYGIARNLIKDELRKFYRRGLADAENVRQEAATVSSEPELLSTIEVRAAFSRLSVEEREILLLADVEEFTCPEIARILWLGEEAVKSRVRRARYALGAELSRGGRKSTVRRRRDQQEL